MSSVIENTAAREFLGARPGVLGDAAKWLVQRHLDGDRLDMSGAILVFPTARSGRRLMELILNLVEDQSLVLTPPHVTTIGPFPELLYRPERPLATPIQQQLAWIQALQGVSADSLRAFTSQIPDSDNAFAWLSLARVLQRWHHDLAGNALDFNDVLQTGRQLKHFPERHRWEILCEVQRRYLDALNDLQVWDRQTARLVAIQQNECQTDKQIYLLGAADLTQTVRQMLQQVGSSATAIVFAEPTLSDHFDELGCLQIDRWVEFQNRVPDEAIRVADQPVDQARLVAEFLAGLNGKYAAEEIVIGVPEPKLIPQLNRALFGSGIETHDLGGYAICKTRPYTLMELIAQWMTDERFESFAALVRHPDMHQWLRNRLRSSDWLEHLDRFQNDRLPFSMPVDPLSDSVPECDAVVSRLHNELRGLVKSLVGGPRHLKQWSLPWRSVLMAVYSELPINRDDREDQRLLESCRQLMTALAELEIVDDYWQLEFDALDALDLVLVQLADHRVHQAPIENSIDLLGWLDIPLDDAPVAVVTNFNDGWIPSFENSSLFLPNSLRAKLGLVDNERRFARDAYALHLLLESKQQVCLISGRFDHDNQPLLPSRLLLAGNETAVAERAKKLFGPGESLLDWSLGLETDVENGLAARPGQQQLSIPMPTKAFARNSLRVTDFCNYLNCPYRFFLTAILRLERIDDDADEMDAGQFGHLVHEVVEEFGKSDIRNSSKLSDVRDFLLASLDRISFRRFGKQPLPAVQVQLQQMRLRLQAFAEWQIEHRKAGWEIFEVEERRRSVTIDLDGKPFEIRGQIDRVDLNHDKKLIGIFDYKTGDVGQDPEQSHRKNGQWKNLQLPLYRWLARELDLPGDYGVQLAYIVLPRDISKISLKIADWTVQQLAEADEAALAIMRKVRAGEFWPMNDRNIPPFWRDLDPICQSHVYQKWICETPQGESPSDREGADR